MVQKNHVFTVSRMHAQKPIIIHFTVQAFNQFSSVLKFSISSVFLIGFIIQYFLLFFLFRSLCTSAIHILHHDAFRWYSLPLRRAVLSKNRDNGSALPQRVHSLRSTPSTTTRLRGFLLTISHGPHSDAPYLLQYARECLPHLEKDVQSERGTVW